MWKRRLPSPLRRLCAPPSAGDVLLDFAVDAFRDRSVWVATSSVRGETRLTGGGTVMPLWSTRERVESALTHIADGAECTPTELDLGILRDKLALLGTDGEVGVNLAGRGWCGLNVSASRFLEAMESAFDQIGNEQTRQELRLFLDSR